MSLSLKDIELLARQEFLLKSGTRVFDIPCKQLFDYTEDGELKVSEGSELNRATIAQLALDFKDCTRTPSGVSLRDSLTLGDDGSTLVRATGSKLMCAVTMDSGGSLKVTGHILYMDLKPKVLPDDVAKIFTTLNADLSKAIYLELICSTAKTGAGTLLMLCLLKKLDGAKTGILADAVNASSDAFFQKFGFKHIRTSKPSLWWMSKADAMRLANKTTRGFLDHLRLHESLREVCVRKGATNATSHREFWDCR